METELMSNLPRENKTANYITCATIKDDSGNYYIQGYVKTSKRIRVSTMFNIVGNMFLRTCLRPCDIIMEIQMARSFKEVGTDPTTNKFCKELAELKIEIDKGASIYQIMKIFPTICMRTPET